MNSYIRFFHNDDCLFFGKEAPRNSFCVKKFSESSLLEPVLRDLAPILITKIAKAVKARTTNPPIQPKTSLATHEESLFIEPNDYCTIRYQGHVASLKSTRGLHYLAVLLRDPEREFHVSELLAHSLSASTPGAGIAVPDGDAGGLPSGFPVLDAQAKAEYKRRINELQEELEEAEGFNDAQRKTEIQSELQAICDNLAYAVGLGGRDRQTSSDAERARSAVTKCIKKAIQNIGEAIPSLGYHFAASIKTGYFCSYNPYPDRPVAWKFYLEFLIYLALCESSLPLC